MMALEKSRNCSHDVRKYLREYTEVTGIHGLRYIGEKRSRTEKIIWSVLFLLSVVGCVYMIYGIWSKYENSPVVVSFATEDTPLYRIPFPAITICPEAKYSRALFNYTKVFFQVSNGEDVEEEELKKFNHLSMLCDEDDNVTQSTTEFITNEFYETIDELKLDPTIFLPGCFFGSEDCSSLFTPIIVDEGICYSFNILNRQEIFKDHVFHYKDYYKTPFKAGNDFDIENGYHKGIGINAYPRRTVMSGADNSLSIFFTYNTSESDFICNNFLQGFRVLIHNPWDVPQLSKHYFRIPFGKVVIAAMQPEMVTTSETVRRFSPEKRKCFMKDEGSLKHFKYYTQSNCVLECITNYTLKKCGCVTYSMPRDNQTKLCGTGSTKCLNNIESEMNMKELDSQISGNNFCNCKPSCTNLKFNVETSHSNFYFQEYFQVHSKFNYKNDGSHWSVLELYFKEEQFTTTERNELYGISDLISNFGGLLGLFTGFSLISGAEILYFCSLRLFCNERLYGQWAGPPD